MNTVVRRRINPVADVLNWLESEPPFTLAAMGLTPHVRVEDFIEDDAYLVRAELPGIDPEKDVQVEIAGNALVIRGERKEEQKERNRHEFHYGYFERRLELPNGARFEDVKATYTDGVLEVRIPRVGEQTSTKQVPVVRGDS